MRRMIDRLVLRLGAAGRVLLLLWLLIAIGLISLVVPACVQLTHRNWTGALAVVGRDHSLRVIPGSVPSEGVLDDRKLGTACGVEKHVTLGTDS